MVEQAASTATYLDAHSETPAMPPGPMKGTWGIRYLDLHKSARLMLSKARKAAYKEFPDVLSPGTPFPAMELETTDGVRFNTADLKGRKHFVVMTGAIT